MPSKRMSSACVDYVPALCTHRPSLLPIEWLSEAFGLAQGGRQRPPRAGKFVKLGHLEEVKVVNKVSVGEPAEGSLPEMVGLRAPVPNPLLTQNTFASGAERPSWPPPPEDHSNSVSLRRSL